MSQFRECVINEVTVAGSHSPPSFRLQMFSEVRSGVFRQIYESPLFKFHSPHETLLVQEKFSFLSAHDCAFLKIVVCFANERAHPPEEFFFLFADLVKDPTKVALSLASLAQIRINFDPEGAEFRMRCKRPSTSSEPEVLAPNLIENFLVTQEFVLKVGLVRRITNELFYFAVEKDFKRDFLFVLGCALILLLPKLTLLLLFCLHCFTDLHFHLRFYFISKLEFYGGDSVLADELKKNIAWIRDQQVAIIAFVEAFKKFFSPEEKNKRLQVIFGQFPWVLVGAALLSCFSFCVLILLGLLGLFAAKYQTDIRHQTSSYFSWTRKWLVLLHTTLKSFEGGLTKEPLWFRRRPAVKLTKHKFYFEEQHSFLRSPTKRTLIEDLKGIIEDRPAQFASLGWESVKPRPLPSHGDLDFGWEWIGEWHLVRSSGTDNEGWTYESSLPSFLQIEDSRLNKSRRRQWVRACSRRVSSELPSPRLHY